MVKNLRNIKEHNLPSHSLGHHSPVTPICIIIIKLKLYNRMKIHKDIMHGDLGSEHLLRYKFVIGIRQ